jgi:hypothetical protein
LAQPFFPTQIAKPAYILVIQVHHEHPARVEMALDAFEASDLTLI